MVQRSAAAVRSVPYTSTWPAHNGSCANSVALGLSCEMLSVQYVDVDTRLFVAMKCLYQETKVAVLHGT